MANTSILIKRSGSLARPSTLLAGELGYSYLSNTIFIGTPDGTGVINIGGVYYTSQIDSATDAATNNALVRRSANGSATFSTVYGALGTDSGVTAGAYGSTTEIPVITVGSNGLVTNVTTASISTSFDIAGDTGTGTVNAGETLTFAGRDGISTVSVDANNTVLIDVDNTVIRTTGGQTINGNLSITGNVILSGNTTQIDVQTLNVSDPMIYLAGNNYSSDIVDIGFVGNYFDGSSQRHTGFIRKHATNNFYAFTNYEHEPDNNIIDVNDASFVKANIFANFTGGTVSGLSSAIAVGDGGTGASTLTSGGVLIGNGTGALQVLANSTYTQSGTLTTSNTITSITVDAYGRFTGSTSEKIAIDTNQITSGILPIARGGTNNDTYTSNQIVFHNGTSLVSLANSSYVATGVTPSGNSTITSITVDGFGRLTDTTFSYISGLNVDQGGTGASTFTQYGIMYGNAGSALQATAAAGTSDQGWSNQLLTTTDAGVPVWTTTLDGGHF